MYCFFARCIEISLNMMSPGFVLACNGPVSNCFVDALVDCDSLREQRYSEVCKRLRVSRSFSSSASTACRAWVASATRVSACDGFRLVMHGFRLVMHGFRLHLHVRWKEATTSPWQDHINGTPPHTLPTPNLTLLTEAAHLQTLFLDIPHRQV